MDNSELFKAIKDRNLNSLQKFVNPNNINAPDSYGWTLLHRAIQIGDLEIVTFLVSNGADVLATNKDGHDSLAVAKLNNRKKIISYLCDFLPSDQVSEIKKVEVDFNETSYTFDKIKDYGLQGYSKAQMILGNYFLRKVNRVVEAEKFLLYGDADDLPTIIENDLRLSHDIRFYKDFYTYEGIYWLRKSSESGNFEAKQFLKANNLNEYMNFAQNAIGEFAKNLVRLDDSRAMTRFFQLVEDEGGWTKEENFKAYESSFWGEGLELRLRLLKLFLQEKEKYFRFLLSVLQCKKYSERWMWQKAYQTPSTNEAKEIAKIILSMLEDQNPIVKKLVYAIKARVVKGSYPDFWEHPEKYETEILEKVKEYDDSGYFIEKLEFNSGIKSVRS